MQHLLSSLAARLQQHHLRLCTAESCTGGLIAASCTALAGSSDWFEAGFVTYSLATKTDLLGVDPNLIKRYGAVSEPVARAMAIGALRRCQADLSVSVTGIAGPGGGEVLQPVGRVWLAWATRDRSTDGAASDNITLNQASSFDFSGDRNQVRNQAVTAALEGCLAALEPDPESGQS